MTPAACFDLILQESTAQLPAPDLGLSTRISLLWRALHCARAKGPGDEIQFAIAFPQWMEQGFTLGKRVRVFCQGAADAERLLQRLDTGASLDALMKAGVMATNVRAVDGSRANGFEAYMMRRISSGVSKNAAARSDANKGLQERARLRRMAEQRSLPFVWMESSSGNRFKLVIERVLASSDLAGKPNGYGLSRETQVIALPVLSP